MMRWRRRSKEPLAEGEPISPEDLAWRIGATGARPDTVNTADEAAGPMVPAGPADPDRPATGGRRPSDDWRFVSRARPVISGATRRLVLGRDASAVLFGIVAVILIAQFALLGEPRGTAENLSGGESGLPSEGATVAADEPGIAGLPTIGPVIDPGLIAGIEATPTPVPTPVPTPTPVTRRPVPLPTLRPTSGPPKPTTKPTGTPAPTPSPSPSPSPTPVPPPPPPPPTPLPVAAFSCVPVAQSLQIDCTNTSVGADSYAWDFGDGNGSPLSNPSHTYAAAGPYTVVLTATNVTGDNVATHGVTVPPLPVAAFSCVPVAQSLQIDCTNTSVGADSYAWDFGDGNGSPLSNPSHTYAAAGPYTVVLTATNVTGDSVATQGVTVTGP